MQDTKQYLQTKNINNLIGSLLLLTVIKTNVIMKEFLTKNFSFTVLCCDSSIVSP